MFTPPNHVFLHSKPLREALSHVFLVVPLSQDPAAERMVTYEIPQGSRAELYDQFVRDFRPQLTETAFSERKNPFGLRKLVVPGKRGEPTGRGFLVHADNYFFKRGASTTMHPAWKSMHTGAAAEDGAWLKSHRGENFVVELRRHLRTFCAFQARNAEVVNAFVRFVHLARAAAPGVPGLAVIDPAGGLPAGVAERLLDYWYLGENEAGMSLDGLPLEAAPGQWDWVEEESEFRVSLPRLANAFRNVLLGNADGYPASGWTNLAHRALQGEPKLENEEGREVLEPTIPAGEFKAARESLKMILEMLPSRALPQEALAWVLEELFEVTSGTRKPLTAPQHARVAKTVAEGQGNQVAPPGANVLSVEERERLRKRVLDCLDEIVTILAEPGTKKERSQALTTLLGAELAKLLTDHEAVNELISVVVPSLPVERESERPAMLKRAAKLMRLAFESRVVPALFSSPVLTFAELYARLKGQSYGLMLVAMSLHGQQGFSADEALAKLAQAEKKAISDDLATPWTQERELHHALTLAVQTMIAMGQAAPGLKTTVKLWLEAQQLLQISPAATEATVVSSLQNLRSAEGRHAMAASPPPLGRELVRRLATIKAKALHGLRKAARQKAEATAAAERAEAEVVRATASVTAAREKKAEAAGTESGTATTGVSEAEKKAAEAQAAVERAARRVAEASTSFEAAEREAREANVPSAAPESSATSSAGVVEDTVDRIFRDLGLTTASADEPVLEAEEVVQKVLQNYESDPTNAVFAQEMLKAYEHLNHRVYSVYAKVRDHEADRQFAREVEALTLGRIMLATKERCGLDGESSGLLKLLLDLMQHTGLNSANGADVHGTEVLQDHSLYLYLDGAHLKTGQQIATLHDDLAKCAQESFQNITSYISELQSIRYLLLHAPAGTKVTIFNDRGGEFWPWLEAEHLHRIGPFSVNSRRHTEDPTLALPGLLYLARDVAQSFQDLKLRQGDYGFLLPPVVVQAGAFNDKAPPFPWFSVGPDLPLNSDSDMPTKIPAPYPVLLQFLQRHMQGLGAVGAHLATTDFDDDVAASFRTFRVKGVGAKIDQELQAVFTGTLGGTREQPADPGYAFGADYYLYVVLRLWADCEVQSPADLQGAGAPWVPSFLAHWHFTNEAGPSELLDEPPGNEWERCFPDCRRHPGDPAEPPSIKTYRFDRPPAKGTRANLIPRPAAPGAPPPVAARYDTSWFDRAVHSFWP